MSYSFEPVIDLRLCGTPEHSFKGIDMLLLHNGQ